MLADGEQVLACQTKVERDLVVTLPKTETGIVLTDGIRVDLPAHSGVCLAIDIGTTKVAAYLLCDKRTVPLSHDRIAEIKKKLETVIIAGTMFYINY